MDLFDEDLGAFEFEGAEVLPIRDYAKYKGLAPQLVYYYIRTKKIETNLCQCGRKIINVRDADAALTRSKEDRRKA